MTNGPLAGIRVIEFAGIGPGQHCAMLLADLGADVLRIGRLGHSELLPVNVYSRGKRSMSLDLQLEAHRLACLQLLERADALIEGFRPGVMERLGLGPDVVLARNPELVFGRLTGWGQDGPLAQAAGHDINYIALTGALAGIGSGNGPPTPPLNLVGDFGGGSMFLAMGILAALLEVKRSGRGQVVDAAMIDGVASLMAWFRAGEAGGWMTARRGENFLDGSAHYYRCYECSDGLWISVGAIEPRFYNLLLEKLGIPESRRPSQKRESWQAASALLQEIFKTRTRDEWCRLLEGTDACVAPVLELDEAPRHAHMQARSAFVESFGVVQPAPAPRFSRTPGEIQGPPPVEDDSLEAALRRWPI